MADGGRAARRSSSCSRRSLSITTFRYVPSDLRATLGDEAVEHHLDALNRELLDRLQRGGEAFVSNAVVGGRYCCAPASSTSTPPADVEAVPDIVVSSGTCRGCGPAADYARPVTWTGWKSQVPSLKSQVPSPKSSD